MLNKPLRRAAVVAAFSLLLGSAAWSKDSAPKLLTPFACDIDHDGQNEIVGLRPFVQDGVELGQLVLFSRDGELLWEGPRHSESPICPQEPDVFLGEFDYGDLEAVGDLEGDGRLLLLGTYQKSDVSPTRFRLLEWNGKAFEHLRSGYLAPANQRPGTFVWSDDQAVSSWVESVFGPGPDGLLRAVIKDSGGQIDSEVTLKPVDGEFVIRQPVP